MRPPPLLLSPLQKHLPDGPGSLLLLLLSTLAAIGTCPSLASSSPPELSFSECLQLERSPLDSGRSAKVLSVIEGMPAYLHCPRQGGGVANLMAAWTRMRDAALLAVGDDTFTMDMRFQISKPRERHSDWVLILRRTGPGDQGCYLCEVNTDPVSTLVPTYLKVKPIRGEGDQLTRGRQKPAEREEGAEENGQTGLRGTRLEARIEGSTLVMNCSVERGDEEPAFWPTVLWTRNGKPLDLRNEKKFSTDFRVSDSRKALVFSLRVREVSPSDDNGLYACQGDRLVRSAEIVQLPAGNSVRPPPSPPGLCHLSLLLSVLVFFFFLKS